MRISMLVVCAALIMAATGCQSFDMSTMSLPWQKDKDTPVSDYETPQRMVAVWSETVFFSGGVPTRGFGGRLYLYNAKGQAIPVEGQLAVFAYDDTGITEAPPESRPPDKRYVFTSEQFTKHFSKSDLGASYSVWIPWDPAGGEPRHISLLPVFTTLDNKILAGQQTLNVLPGKALAEEELPLGANEGAQVTYQAPINEPVDTPTPSNLRTTTIRVPKQSQIRNLPPQEMQRPLPEAQPTTSPADPAAIFPSPEGSAGEARGSESSPQPGPWEQFPAHSARMRSRVRATPVAQRGHDRIRTLPGHEARPFAPPSSPTPAWPTEAGESFQTGH
jgi:hypothetical protein